MSSKKKLNEVYGIREDAVDKALASGSPLKVLAAWGINKNEIKTAEDLQNVMRHFTRMIASSIGGLAGKVKPGIDEPRPGSPNIANVNPELEKALSALAQAASKVAKTPAFDPSKAPKVEPQKQPHPATGYSDDPNPETRNTKFPNRSYRAG